MTDDVRAVVAFLFSASAAALLLFRFGGRWLDRPGDDSEP